MKIAQICTFDIDGGAARASYRLHRGMIGLGHESVLLVLDKISTDETVHEIRAGAAADEFTVRCLQGIQRHSIESNRTPVSNTMFSLPYPAYDLTALDEVATADVINLHWVARLQSPITIRDLLTLGKPVVWTLHDMRPFTGGCHYSSGCHGYEEGCYPCPQLDRDPNRLPAALLSDNIEAIRDQRLVVVTPSEWLGACARRSQVFRKTRVEVIPNSLETDTFAPLPKREAKQRLGLGPETLTLLAGAHDGKERRKGFPELAAALEACLGYPHFRDWVSRDVVKLLWLGLPPDRLAHLPVPVVPLGRITSDAKLREIYCAADVYVLPSLEDNLPNTILEAMSCGTPVVAFGSGGVPEIVADGITGRVVPTGDVIRLARAIVDCLHDGAACAKMGEAGRHLVQTAHALPVQAQRYLDLYAELLSAATPRPRPSLKAGPGVTSTSSTVPDPPATRLFAPLDARIGPAFAHILPEASLQAAQADLDRSKAAVAALETELQQTRLARDRLDADAQRLRETITAREDELLATRAARDRFHLDAQGLRGTIAAMQSTKFWKLRIVWFRLKRAIGLPCRD